MYLQYRSNGYKEGSSHSFLAGLIGGYLIFGKENNINKQVILLICL
jgi:peroxisomal membrane protein 4